MREITVRDTLSREPRPIETGREVAIYACGPTVYSRIHIGNARPFVVFSLFARFLRAEGYRVRLVRGAGVTEARWSAVEDAVTAIRRGVACVELRLRDGRTTTIPVGVLAVDREQFVRELQGRLQRGHGLRPL